MSQPRILNEPPQLAPDDLVIGLRCDDRGGPEFKEAKNAPLPCVRRQGTHGAGEHVGRQGVPPNVVWWRW